MTDIEKLNLAFYSLIQDLQAIPYEKIEGMPISTVDGHAGRFVFGYVRGVPVVIMQGRVHLYEGYTSTDSVLPIRLMKLMGAEYLFLSNAAGGITYLDVGTLVLIKDQISQMVPSPLRGPNMDALGTRFPSMSEIYDKHLRDIAKDCAKKLNIDIKEGVYLQFGGPQYETPAEIRMAKILGADVVGMSTCTEAIAGAHMGMKILGVSCVSNPAAGLGDIPLDHMHVKETMHKEVQKLAVLAGQVIQKLKEENKW